MIMPGVTDMVLMTLLFGGVFMTYFLVKAAEGDDDDFV